MNEKKVMQVLSLLSTMQEACQYLYSSVQFEDDATFRQMYSDIHRGLASIVEISKKENSVSIGAHKLYAGSQSCLDSLQQICLYWQFKREICIQKIEFELLPLLQETYLQFYYFGYLSSHSDELEAYYNEKIYSLCANPYIDEAIQKGHYKYDISIMVLGYNKLEYTKQCVKCLEENLPTNLRYELIFVNHGSTDGTKAYFASKSPDKQLDISVNGGGVSSYIRLVEGEFTIHISNDVLIGKNTIENLVACIRSDPQIAWVVPSTPNVSNLQSIPATYDTEEEFIRFTEHNNQSNPFRWEQRTRLCNPIDIIRNSVFVSSSGLCLNGRFHSFDSNSFPDDKMSLFLRRNGYKMMIAKDAYCHHFGSVTLKSEVQKKGEAEYYLNGRKSFYNAYGVDPWGTGFCFAKPFLKRVVGNESAHVDILGISCGFGANSLKIKEQIKEYCYNMDVSLCNITDAEQYKQDLEGVSDEVQIISSVSEARDFLSIRCYQYIIWEDGFLVDAHSAELISLVRRSLASGGTFFAKKHRQTIELINIFGKWHELGENWVMYKNE
ncbi:glycosyltransferase [Candidatus Agathobaculum pullicola]|uniref:glycosyltransferase n=1 Tax=Candidatus Agathobaculum pullicola TaxID=2838426 RepID=UPI003F8D9D58